jgi:hypothetical protein
MSRRRFLICMCIVSCLQMFIVLSAIQLAAPKLTTVIYEVKNHTTVDYCDSEEGRNSTWCYAQGPLTIYRAIGSCPLLLLNGIVNLAYYLGEAALYQQSLGVLMLVLAALSSSFIIAPLQDAAGLRGGGGVPAGVLVLGICGAIVCVVERKPKPSAVQPVPATQDEEGGVDNVRASGAGSVNTDEEKGDSEKSPLTPDGKAQAQFHSQRQVQSQAVIVEEGDEPLTGAEKARRMCLKVLSYVPLLLPFGALATVYAVYFVLMLLYNDQCKSNMWGYNSVDQVLLPLYLLLMFIVIDVCPKPLRNTFTANEDKQESFVQAFKGAVGQMLSNKGEGLLNLFTYRLLINGRALVYSYIAVRFDLSTSYLQLTLIRVVLSWLASLFLVLVFPRFIRTESEEQAKLKDRVNIALKILGTVLIVGSLLLLHKNQL